MDPSLFDQALANVLQAVESDQKVMDEKVKEWEATDPNFSREEFYRNVTDPESAFYSFSTSNSKLPGQNSGASSSSRQPASAYRPANSFKSSASVQMIPEEMAEPQLSPIATKSVSRQVLKEVCVKKTPSVRGDEPIKPKLSVRKPAPVSKLPPPTPLIPKENKESSSDSSKKLQIQGKVYILEGEIGKGGSCKVYKAVDIVIEEQVAIKIVDFKGLDRRLQTLHLNECKILEELQGSDYVVILKGYEVKSNKLYVVMERGDCSLADTIEAIRKNERVIDENFIRYVFSEMLRCVQVIHEKNIIHSDLKPANFLSIQGRLKLIDFGIAAKLNDQQSYMNEGIVGTPNYMAPEAVKLRTNGDKQGYEITLKSDVWSLGIMLYALLFGQSPFSQVRGNIQKCEAIQKMPIKFEKVENVKLRALMKKCLNRNPEERPTVAELLTHPYLNVVDVVNETLADADFAELHNIATNNTPRTARRKMQEAYLNKRHR